MLIGTFKKSRILSPVFLILVSIVLWLDGFLFFNHHRVLIQDIAPLYRIILPFYENYPLLQVIGAWGFLVLQAFLINHVVTSKGLIDRYALLPALVYVVLMSSNFELLSLHPVLFANFFLIIALDKIFDTFTEKDVALEVFNVGLLVSLAGLFYLPALWFFFLAVASLFIYRVGNIRGILATILGYVTPFLFVGVIYYLTDSLQEGIGLLRQPMFFQIFGYSFSRYLQVFIVFLGFLFLVSFVRVIFIHISDKPVRIRKRFNILIWFLIIALISALTTSGFFEIHLALLFVPMSMLMAVFFMEMKRKRWSEIIFSLLILLIIVGKLARLD